MKKKIIIFLLLFMFVFCNNVFAKTLTPMDNINPHKTWTITFNKPIESATITILNESGRGVPHVKEIQDNKVTVMPLLDYAPGTYVLKIVNAESKEGEILKEVVSLQFTVR